MNVRGQGPLLQSSPSRCACELRRIQYESSPSVFSYHEHSGIGKLPGALRRIEFPLSPWESALCQRMVSRLHSRADRRSRHGYGLTSFRKRIANVASCSACGSAARTRLLSLHHSILSFVPFYRAQTRQRHLRDCGRLTLYLRRRPQTQIGRRPPTGESPQRSAICHVSGTLCHRWPFLSAHRPCGCFRSRRGRPNVGHAGQRQASLPADRSSQCRTVPKSQHRASHARTLSSSRQQSLPSRFCCGSSASPSARPIPFLSSLRIVT